jgi:DNA primase
MGIVACPSDWTLTVSGERIDWNDIKGRIDLARVVTALLGPAPKRLGRRLLWPCPFHDEHNPSFEVDPQRGTWRCWPCNLGGDAPALVMKRNGVGFPEAVRVVADLSGYRPRPNKAPAQLRGPRHRQPPENPRKLPYRCQRKPPACP